jgi:hypothetical protein
VQKTRKNSKLVNTLEILGVLAPILCLVDCIVVPLALLVLPFVGVTHVMHGMSDQLLTLLMVAICVPAVVPGFLKHRQVRVLALMAAGFGAIFFANIVGGAVDETVHFLLTACGSACLIKANWDNRRLSRVSASESCCSQDHR